MNLTGGRLRQENIVKNVQKVENILESGLKINIFLKVKKMFKV